MSDHQRIPPHSEEAERGLIGALLLDSTRVMEICATRRIGPDAFYVPATRTIYHAALALHTKGRPIDSLSVCESLRMSGDLEAAGGLGNVESILDACPTTAHADYYASIVAQKATLRRVIDESREAIAQAYACEDDAESVRSRAEARLAAIQPVDVDRRSNAEVMREEARKFALAREKKCAGTPTGFRVFDRYFGGLVEAGFYIVSGLPGSCKTTLVRNVAENVAIRGHPVLILSLEQTRGQILAATNARFARQSIFHLMTGNQRADPAALEEHVDYAASLPMTVIDSTQTLSSIRSHARRAKSQGVSIVVIDYMQRIVPEKDYRGSVEREVSDVSLGLCNMAKELRVTVLAISSLSRTGKLRGSGQLDYDAWAWVNLARSEYYSEQNPEIDVAFEKNRYGPPACDEQLWLLANENRLDESRPITAQEVARHAR